MTVLNKKIELLIREIDPTDKNGRYMRENLRRLQLFLDGIVDGSISVGNSQNATTSQTSIISQSPDSFNRYESYLVASNGQTGFTLLDLPKTPDKVAMTVNGQDMTNNVHFTVSGKNVTFIPGAAGYILEAVNEFGVPDLILFKYTV